MSKTTKKSGKRAVVTFNKSKETIEKNVPRERAFLIAAEYRKKTGKPVSIRMS